MKLRKGDTIIVTVGKDKGRKGKVEAVYRRNGAVLVPEVNVFKRHMKKKDEKQQGGIIAIPRAIDASKVSLVCPSCGKPTRVGYLLLKSEKIRICKKCGKKV